VETNLPDNKYEQEENYNDVEGLFLIKTIGILNISEINLTSNIQDYENNNSLESILNPSLID
jgi:hypothetical protein